MKLDLFGTEYDPSGAQSVVPTKRHKEEIDKFFQDALDYESDECLIWPFGKSSSGYPSLWRFRKRYRTDHVTRVICFLKHGMPPTPKHEAAHSCNNKPCINHRHLRWATTKENAEDKLIDGTHTRGERNGHAKLIESDVLEIRENLERLSAVELARKYGVSVKAINLIKQYKNWAWLNPEDQYGTELKGPDLFA